VKADFDPFIGIAIYWYWQSQSKHSRQLKTQLEMWLTEFLHAIITHLNCAYAHRE
jgi:hypothetical protein